MGSRWAPVHQSGSYLLPLGVLCGARLCSLPSHPPPTLLKTSRGTEHPPCVVFVPWELLCFPPGCPSAAPTALGARTPHFSPPLPRPELCLDEDSHCENAHSFPLSKHRHIAVSWKQKVHVTNNKAFPEHLEVVMCSVSLGGTGSPGCRLPGAGSREQATDGVWVPVEGGLPGGAQAIPAAGC